MLTVTENPRLTLSEAAEYLRISKSSLYQLTHRREIPHMKLSQGRGGRVIFDRQQLDNWLAERRAECAGG